MKPALSLLLTPSEIAKRENQMAGTKIKTNHDQRKSPTKKLVYQNETIDQSNILPNTKSKDPGVTCINRFGKEKTWTNEKTALMLSNQLLEWALNQPKNTKLMRFFWKKGYGEDVVSDLAAKFPEFKEDLNLARAIIGGNLWDGALFQNSGMREGAALKYLPCYDKEYLAELKRQAAERISLQNSKPNEVVTVLIPKFVDEKEMDERSGKT